MKTISKDFKDEIKNYGREFDDIITYGLTTLGQEDINSITFNYNCELLKTQMKGLTIDSNTLIPIGTTLNYSIGLKVNGSYEYINYGNFIVKEIEEQKDTKSYLIICYDKILLSMVDVVSLGLTYPVTVRNYLSAICTHLGLTFANASDTFTNYDQEVEKEHYLSYNSTNQTWESLGYTFRDILDDLAEVTGSFIVINENDELELKKVSNAKSPKNLFDQDTLIPNMINNTTYKQYSDGVLTMTNNSTDTYMPSLWNNANYINGINVDVEKNTDYVFSFEADQPITTLKNAVMGLNESTNKYAYIVSLTANNVLTFNTGNYKKIAFRIGSTASVGTVTHFSKFQLEKGNAKTDFEPYVDTINEEYFNDTNVNIGKHYGPVNVIVLSRAEVDNLYYPSTLPLNPCEIKISDNPILEQDDREDFIQGIYNSLNGLEFDLCDFNTKGILYYELGDKYNVSIDGNTHSCLMLNDEISRTTGLKEYIYTDEPQTSVTDYKYASSTDRLELTSRNAYIKADKAEGKVEAVVSAIGDDNGDVTSASLILAINENNDSTIKLEADQLNLNGAVTANNNFKIKNDGSVEINNGQIDLIDTDQLQPTVFIRLRDYTLGANSRLSYDYLFLEGLARTGLQPLNKPLTYYKGEGVSGKYYNTDTNVSYLNLDRQGLTIETQENNLMTEMVNVNSGKLSFYDNSYNETIRLDGSNANIEINGNYIIESGSDTNGHYAKFYDGTLIQWNYLEDSTIAFSNNYGSRGIVYLGSKTITFPIAFVGDTPSVTCGEFKWGTSGSWGAVGNITLTDTTLFGYDLFQRASGTKCYISWYAIGKWK